jgi:hypothetical protein
MSGARKRLALKEMLRDQLLQQLIHVEHVQVGKHVGNKRKHCTSNVDIDDSNWRKKSIFFKLSYWSALKLRHNLDVIHIEKKICDSILCTLMNIPRKTKDTANT